MPPITRLTLFEVLSKVHLPVLPLPPLLAALLLVGLLASAVALLLLVQVPVVPSTMLAEAHTFPINTQDVLFRKRLALATAMLTTRAMTTMTRFEDKKRTNLG